MNLKCNLIQRDGGGVKELRNKKILFLILYFLFNFFLLDCWCVVNHPLFLNRS